MTVSGMRRSDLLTVIAVACLAYAIDDIVHEGLGHGTACVVLGVRMLGLSTIGLQTETSSRLVAAAGSIANVVVGALALAGAARGPGFGIGRYFLWLLGFVNLMNGTGYLTASAVASYGDWAVVIAGREPAIVWRLAMGFAGVVTFIASTVWARGILRRWLAAGEVSPDDMTRLTTVPYLAGGLIFVLASALNPVGPEMILASGVAASFGLTFGLLIAGRGAPGAPPGAAAAGPLPRRWGWIGAGFGAAALFIGVLGPGVRF